MRRSRLILVIIFIITVILGGIAVWIGLRLSREEEVVPEESEAGKTCCGLNTRDECCDSIKCIEANCDDDGENDDMWCKCRETCPPSSADGSCDKSRDCCFDCDDGHPSDPEVKCNSDCNPNTREIDICRGRQTNANCQFCGKCTDCGDKDKPCHCCEGLALDDNCWAHCYEKGNGYNPQAGEYPNAPYWDGTYNCRNIQLDVMLNGSHIWNCRSDDGRDWWDCAPEPLSLQGRVYCQDEGDANVYPVEGAIVNVYKDGIQATENVTTGAQGSFTNSGYVTQGGFAVRFGDLPDGELSNGQPYSAMVGPTAVNCTDGTVTGCTGGSASGSFCGGNNSSYEQCGLAAGDHTGFDFVYTNCTAAYNCGNECRTEGEACDDGTTCHEVERNGEQVLTCVGTDYQDCEIEQHISNGCQCAGFNVEKNATVVCVNDDTAARITYNISVTNNSDVAGQVYSVTDTYDSRFERTWIDSTSITPDVDQWEGNVLTWNNGGDGWLLGPGEELTFSYIVTVPEEYFGDWIDDDTYVPYQYRNFVVVRTENGDFEREVEVEISCLHLGVFDNAVLGALVALLMIMLGMTILRNYKNFDLLLEKGYSTWPISAFVEKVSEDRRKKGIEDRLKRRENRRGKK